MQRVRGAAAVVLLGGSLLLSACRANPEIAAYVGSEQITEADITSLMDDVTAKVAAAKKSPPPAAAEVLATLRPPSRSEVLITLVLGRLCAERKAREGFTDVPVTEQDRVQIAPVPDATYYANRLATLTCVYGMPAPQNVEPTEAETRDIYDRLVDAGAINDPYDQIKAQIAADAGVRQALARKHAIAETVADADISVNPRYRPMEFVISYLQNGKPGMVAVVGEPGSGAVRDIT